VWAQYACKQCVDRWPEIEQRDQEQLKSMVFVCIYVFSLQIECVLFTDRMCSQWELKGKKEEKKGTS
jgi:hypothetical protein